MIEKCHCGQPLHYAKPEIARIMHELVKAQGEFVEITCEGVTYRVQRHYAALHGIKGSELPGLGFEIIQHV